MKKISLLVVPILLSLNTFGSTEVDIVNKFKKDYRDFVKYQYSQDNDRLSMCYMYMEMFDTYNKLSEDQKLLAINSSNKKKVNRSFSIGNKQCKYWVQ
jgi:hypothetical protein